MYYSSGSLEQGIYVGWSDLYQEIVLVWFWREHSISKIYEGFPKFMKEKYFRMNFKFLHLKFIISTKSASEAAILRSRRFHRHPYQWPG